MIRPGQEVPMLRLSGWWLARAGFDVGQEIEIRVQRGRLTIMVPPESSEETGPIAA
jgi:hypothetical protein